MEWKGDVGTTATKTRCIRISTLFFYHIHHLKRSIQPAAKRLSKLMDINIYELRSIMLVDVFPLSCYTFDSECKLADECWCTLLSAPLYSAMPYFNVFSYVSFGVGSFISISEFLISKLSSLLGAWSGGESTIATKGRCFIISAAARRPSNLMNINIDDLAHVALVDILFPQSCYTFVYECKCVLKCWFTLRSDPSYLVMPCFNVFCYISLGKGLFIWSSDFSIYKFPYLLATISTATKRNSTISATRSSSAARSLSSKLIDINIDDLPNDVLLEIFCRLPSVSFVSQCKCVSKSWCTLMSDPYFIGRFLWQRSDMQTPIIPSLIDSYGDELLTTNVFKRFKSFLSLNKNSRVLATCNDLVLCCANLNDHRDFFICNPRTMQLVTLPPTPRCHISQPLGFICEPYYKKDNAQRKEWNLIDVNAEYRCKVVRILLPDNIADERKICFKFNIQVFSSETGEWRELVVPCPRGFSYCGVMSFASLGNNGFLYWKTGGGLIGLGPFTSNNSSSANGNDTADHYQFHVIEFDEPVKNLFYGLHFLGVYQGCLRMCDHYDGSDYPELFIWELKEEELNEMAVDGTGKLGLKHMEGYALDREMIPEGSDLVDFIACDSNDLDIVYLQAEGDIIKCNICTGIWSKMAVKPPFGRVFQLMLPWWPTPVPRLPQHAHGHA